MASGYACCFLVLWKRNRFDPPLYNQRLLMAFLFGNMLTSARRKAESALSGSSSSCCDMWQWHQLLSDITYSRCLIVLRHFSPQRNLGPSAEITSVSNTSGSVCSSFMCLLVTFFQFSSAEHLNLCQMSLELWANWHFRSNHKSWTPTWPTIVVFKPFLWSIDFLFRVIVLLENKSSPKLQFFCRLQQEVFFFLPQLFCSDFGFSISRPCGAYCTAMSPRTQPRTQPTPGFRVWLCSV